MTESNRKLPIYIIGDNPTAFYLAAQIQSSGERVILLLQQQNLDKSLITAGISIKEDRSLTQKLHRLESSFIMKEPAQMVIVTAYANCINTALSSISSQKIGDAPVVFFTPLKDTDYLRGILNDNLHPAYFNGFLFYDKQSISVLGRGVSVTVCPPTESDKIDEKVLELFTQSKIETVISGNRAESFWEYFAPYALCSIFSAAENKKISELLKDKELKETFRPLAQEFCTMAQADNIILNEKNVLKGVYNTPANYIYPLHQAVINGGKTEFNLISSVIADAAYKTKIATPLTRGFLKKLYNRILG